MQSRNDNNEHVLQKALDEAIQAATAPPAMLALILERKLREQRVRLTSKERIALKAAAAKFLETEDPDVFDKAIPRKRKIEIELTARDLRQFEKLMTDAVGNTVVRMTSNLARDVEPAMKRWAQDQRDLIESEGLAFRDRMARRWSTPFALYSLFRVLAARTGELSVQHLQKEGILQTSRLATALVFLHARACLVAGEVETLMRSGYADGAEARWRTLHEIAVTASFLAEHGEATAERYLAHFACDHLRGAQIYEEHRRRLRYRTLGRASLRWLEAQVAALRQKYGLNFHHDYGWAAVELNRKRVYFKDIEAAVKLQFMRPFYRLGSEQVHASPRGAVRRTGLLDQNFYEADLLAGPTNYGFADAAMNSAHALLLTTACLLLAGSTTDTNVMAMILAKWEKALQRSFVRVQWNIEQREARKKARLASQGRRRSK